MVFTNVINPRSAISRNTDDDFKKTLVRRGASIGANATIVCGSTIGRYAFIGAGAVVTRDVPDFALVYGNPARQHGWVCYCGTSLKKNLAIGETTACADCGRSYRLEEGNRLAPLFDLE